MKRKYQVIENLSGMMIHVGIFLVKIEIGLSPTKCTYTEYMYHIIPYCILLHVFDWLSNRQGESDTREETCMKTQIYNTVKMHKQSMYHTLQ
jgi:hypothetical protein